jgi:hypothetical protein
VEAICINDDGVYLTVGKSYTILETNGDYVKVINDVGMMSEYQKSIFE